MTEFKTWTTTVELNADGDYVISFPDDMLDTVKWVEGDTLEWKPSDDGKAVLINKVGELIKVYKNPQAEQLNLDLNK
jgi:hypothetical protein